MRKIYDRERGIKINKFLKGREILNIGAKEGWLHSFLRKKNVGKKIYSLDLANSDFNINLNKEWNLKKKFDTIVAGEIIEHLDNPVEFIKRCYIHLKRKGRLILTTPNAIGLQYIKNPAWCVGYEEYTGHIHSFTLPMLEDLMEKCNFKIIHKEYLNVFWKRNPLKIISCLIPRLRPDILIVGEKVS